MRGVRTGVVENDEIEPLRISVGEVVPGELKPFTAQTWQFEKKARSTQQRDAVVEMDILQFVRVQLKVGLKIKTDDIGTLVTRNMIVTKLAFTTETQSTREIMQRKI